MPDPVADRIISFLREIGMHVHREPIEHATFLPGVSIRCGALVVDDQRLRYPGDILHEAGHLAVLTPDLRSAADGDVGGDAGLEMGAIAWSYAAALHIGLDPAVVFHPDGYRGGSASLLENFAQGRPIGLPILVWAGLAAASGSRPFPSMLRWLRES